MYWTTMRCRVRELLAEHVEGEPYPALIVEALEQGVVYEAELEALLDELRQQNELVASA